MASNLPKERLHPDIIKLGIVSFLTDLSSEMIFSVFAIFFTTEAGASASVLGLIEGMGDFFASSRYHLGGAFSDRGRKRKGLAAVAYRLSTLAKMDLVGSKTVLGTG